MTMSSPASTPTIRLTRRGLVLAAGGLALSPAAALAQAARDSSAEQFVLAAAEKVLGILRQPASAQRSSVFDQAIDELVDMPKISGFVLGKYGRTIAPAQRTRFDSVFRRYAEGVYEKRLAEYRHATLKVVGSQVRRPGDVVVHTQLSGGPPGDPLIASWRVTRDGGAWKIIDLEFKGVWLAITQQQDFVSTIDNAGGNVDVLIGQLEREAAH